VVKGYFGRPSRRSDRCRWLLRTGDLAERRGEGNLALVGRRSEMFKSGGYNSYSREIELVRLDYPGVALAAVVPIPEPVCQTVGNAFLLPRPGAALDLGEIGAWCRSELANHKVPKRTYIADELPAQCKVDRRAPRVSPRGGVPM